VIPVIKEARPLNETIFFFTLLSGVQISSDHIGQLAGAVFPLTRLKIGG